MAAAFSQIDRSLLEAASTLGSSRWRTAVQIVLPLSMPGIIAGVVLSFAHTVGEFGVVLMVGGNLPGITRTASIAVYDQVQAFQYADANATALLLLAFAFIVLSVVHATTRGRWLVAPRA
jgi:molybdate transport system permease protein